MFFNRIEYSVLETWKGKVERNVFDNIINDLISEFHELDYAYLEPKDGKLVINVEKYKSPGGDASPKETLAIISKVIGKYVPKVEVRAEMVADYVISEKRHDIKQLKQLLNLISSSENEKAKS